MTDLAPLFGKAAIADFDFDKMLSGAIMRGARQQSKNNIAPTD
jgi:hypothetical protein